jgi:hypothetical protein
MSRYWKRSRRNSVRRRSKSGPRPFNYHRLRHKFGGAIDRVYLHFVSLDDRALETFFIRYGVEYGVRAEKYARKTYPKWKAGATNPSDRTVERLVSVVPPFLNSQGRYSILQTILDRHKQYGSSYIIHVNMESPSEGIAELSKALSSMSHHDVLAHLPEHIMQAATWLYADDITVARSMLAKADRAENDIIRAQAKKEIELLKRTILSGQVESANYSVEMPAGSLHVIAYTPPKSLFAQISKMFSNF